MERYTKAIIWPTNPFGNPEVDDMFPEEGDVQASIEFLKRAGAVYWDAKPPRRELKGPFIGYIYIIKPIGEVQYKCDIEWMISRKTLEEMPDEHKFVPPFRRQCLFGKWESGKKHDKSETWIKITRIDKLKEPKKLNEFIKLSDGKPIKKLRSICYVNPV